MEQDNSPQSDDGQSAAAAQIAASKLRQRESALLRSKTAIRRTSSASTDNSQVTERPPQAYQAPQINIPSDLHEVAKLVHGEFEKIAQSQSVLLTLWQQLQGKSAYQQTSNTAHINPNPAHPDSGLEIGATGTQTFIDFHTDAGAASNTDYEARIIVTAEAAGGGNSSAKITSYGTKWEMLHPAMLRSGNSINFYDAANAYSASQRIWDSSSANRGLTMEWDSGYGDGTYWAYLEKNKSTNKVLYHVNGTITASNVTSESGQLTSVPQVEKMMDVNAALLREEVKKEIYAELATIGIVVPAVIE